MASWQKHTPNWRAKTTAQPPQLHACLLAVTCLALPEWYWGAYPDNIRELIRFGPHLPQAQCFCFPLNSAVCWPLLCSLGLRPYDATVKSHANTDRRWIKSVTPIFKFSVLIQNGVACSVPGAFAFLWTAPRAGLCCVAWALGPTTWHARAMPIPIEGG
jgi:hypothetical protein